VNQTPPHPERHMGTRCGRMVDKGHISYPCSRPQGHADIPPGDPEPCYAVEVPTSLRRWQAWAIRQQQAMVDPDVPPDALSAQFGAVHARPPETGIQTLSPEVQPSLHTAVIYEVHCADFLMHESHLWESAAMPGIVNRCDGTGVRPEAVAIPGTPEDVDRAMQEAADEVFLARAREFADCGEACREARAHVMDDPECVLERQQEQAPFERQAMTLSDIDPALIEAITTLSDRYGMLGVLTVANWMFQHPAQRRYDDGGPPE